MLCGIVAVVLLILQFFTQVHRIKSGRANVGGGRVFINWLLVILIVGGFGGSAFMSHQNKQVAAAHPVKAPVTTTKESADTVTLDFDKKVELNDEGEKKVNFAVSPNTKVKIVGHYSRNVFKTFSPKSDEAEFSYTFDQPGTYDIIATNGSKKVVKKLVVKDHSDDSSDDSSSESSSSANSSSSKSSNSSNKSNNSQSTGGSNSSNSGRGNSYTGGGSAYRGGGGGSNYNYTPAAPSHPASTPSAPSNGTGAMTGGSY